MSGENYDALERVIRGAYRNVPPPAAGLCVSCTAPTSSPAYQRCVPCDSFARSGMKTASGGVVPLSWAPMDSQGYQDLRQYKEPSATADQLGRLRTMFALAFSRHTTCIASSDPSRPLGVAHIPSTSGLRPGEHPFETHIMSMLASSVPRVSIRYVGSTDGTRNSRRSLDPDQWEIELPPTPLSRVLVFDDTWVSGGHAQSVAAAFEQRGIASRIVVLGRALDPSRNDHGTYLRAHPATPYDSSICPVSRRSH